jgi:nucleoside 2-deoxyribosyltransferase
MPVSPRVVYLAGPEVFMPECADIITRKEALCKQYGFSPNPPADNHIEARTSKTGPAFSIAIYEANVARIQASDFGVCDLTPFRGPSADIGTVFELGLLTGLGKPVFGYTNDLDDYLERIGLRQQTDLDSRPNPLPSPIWNDEHGWVIENFGNADNLMIDSALVIGGAGIVRRGPALQKRFTDLAAFEACLQEAQAFFNASSTPPA